MLNTSYKIYMKHCSNCGSENLDDAVICSTCAVNFSENTIVVQAEAECKNDSQFNSIGGWLTLIAFGRIIGVLLLPFTIWSFFRLQYYSSTPQQEVYMRMNLVYSILLFFFDIFILVWMFKRKKAFPYIMIGFIIFTFLYSVTLYYICNLFNIAGVDSKIKTIIFNLISCAIWIPYLLKSERVKKTFVN